MASVIHPEMDGVPHGYEINEQANDKYPHGGRDGLPERF
jgi:hypothetical protein